MTPAEEYAARLSVQERRVAELSRREERVAGARLLAGLAVAALIAAKVSVQAPTLWWTLAPLVAFVWLVNWHASMRKSRERAERTAAFYRRGLDRIDDRWAGGGQTGERFLDPHHVYAADLDLFGPASLFELLSSARTRMGEQTLAQWLLGPASAAEIRGRQSCLADLRGRLDLREDLNAAGEIGVGVQPDALVTWTRTANQLQSKWIRAVAIVLPVLAVVTAVGWAWLGIGWPFLGVLLVEIILLNVLNPRIDAVVETAESAFGNLRLLSALLMRIEREAFAAPALQTAQRELIFRSQPASRIVDRLRTITNYAGSRDNMLVRTFLEIPLLYSVHVALAAESWRAQYGAAVEPWLDAIGRFEALSSLAMYSYEHPADPFPEITDGIASIQARELGHPLLAAATCVRNDVEIREPVRALLVSGSNMSGKSTLLRALGINTVLAMAGAPVRAAAMRLTVLQVGASIRANDSLQEGHSRFYAEISRLRQLHELAGRDPALLFLLDELLQGTNSKDRRIGAEGLTREFLARGAIGLISTHDLALTDIGGLQADALRNVHFQDTFDEGRISFDFRLRDGVVTKSNGIELMRSIGLNV